MRRVGMMKERGTQAVNKRRGLGTLGGKHEVLVELVMNRCGDWRPNQAGLKSENE